VSDHPGMRIPREFVDLLYAFFDVAHERGVLTSQQSVFELRIAAGRAAADAVALAAEHNEEPRPADALALFPALFAAEALRDGVSTPQQVEPMRALLGDMARHLAQG
jgi:hypothetical protein